MIVTAVQSHNDFSTSTRVGFAHREHRLATFAASVWANHVSKPHASWALRTVPSLSYWRNALGRQSDRRPLNQHKPDAASMPSTILLVSQDFVMDTALLCDRQSAIRSLCHLITSYNGQIQRHVICVHGDFEQNCAGGFFCAAE